MLRLGRAGSLLIEFGGASLGQAIRHLRFSRDASAGLAAQGRRRRRVIGVLSIAPKLWRVFQVSNYNGELRIQGETPSTIDAATESNGI